MVMVRREPWAGEELVAPHPGHLGKRDPDSLQRRNFASWSLSVSCQVNFKSIKPRTCTSAGR